MVAAGGGRVLGLRQHRKKLCLTLDLPMSRIRNNTCEHTFLEVNSRSSFFLIDSGLLELELEEKAL